MANQVENKIQESQSLVQVKTGVKLYTDEHQLGLVLRPVKTIKIPATTVFGGEGGRVLNDAQKELGATLGALQANLIANRTEIQNMKENEEYGPYIQMPLPEKIKDALKVDYATADLGMMAVGAMFADDIAKPFAGGGLASSMASSASYVIRTLLAGISSGAGGLTSKVAGNVPNPFSAAIFEKVSLRTFNFSWTVQPKNIEESQRLKEIINILRYWSLPNPSKDRLVLAVPYEWILSFYGTNFLYSFSRCVMTELDIDFSPNGFNVFMPTGEMGGAPQSVTISVSFQEIFPLDKATIDSDESGTLDMTPRSGRVFREQDSMAQSAQQSADAEQIIINQNAQAQITKHQEALAKQNQAYLTLQCDKSEEELPGRKTSKGCVAIQKNIDTLEGLIAQENLKISGG